MSTGERRPELDGVRGVAILLVLVGHGGVWRGLGSLGAVGVTLFFVLSGYLITGILLAEHARTGGVNLPRFYARRMTRLAPPLLAMLAVTGLLIRPGWDAILPAATWVSNYTWIAGAEPGPFGHTWSLGVEEQFYLVWPVAFGLLMSRRTPARTLAWIVLGLLAWRTLLVAEGAELYAYGALETAGSAILAGALVALTGWRLLGAWVLPSLVALLVIGYYAPWFTVQLFATPFAAVVVAAAGGCRWLTWRPLVFCGVASYSLYLWHQPVSVIVEGRLGPVGVAVGAAGGVVAYLALEAPLMRWRSANTRRPVARLNGAVLHDAPAARQS